MVLLLNHSKLGAYNNTLVKELSLDGEKFQRILLFEHNPVCANSVICGGGFGQVQLGERSHLPKTTSHDLH